MTTDYGKTNVGPTGDFISFCRGEPIAAGTLAPTDKLLVSMSLYKGSFWSSVVRLAVYQGGTSSSNAQGAVLIADLGETSSSGTNQFETLNANGELLDPNLRTWLFFKRPSGNAATMLSSTAVGTDWEATAWNSTGITLTTSVPYPDPVPSGGSQIGSRFYSMFITVDVDPGPTITSVTPTPLTPSTTGAVATGSTFGASQGTSKLQLSDNSIYGTGTLVDQTVNSWSDTSINFDIVLGGLAEGDLFLFAVLDPGGGGEDASNAFAVNISNPNDKGLYLRMVTQAGTGDQDLTGFGFDPTAAVVWWTANTSQDTAQTNHRQGVYLWTTSYSATMTSGHNTGGTTVNRYQIVGELAIRNGGSTTTQAQATVTQITDGLRFNWSNAAAGYTLHILAFGGTVMAHAASLGVNTSPETGVGFQPDLIFMAGTGQGSFPASSSFSNFTFGFATAATSANEVTQHIYAGGPNSSINSAVRTNRLASQTNTTDDWVLNLSSIDADGFTWTGSNTDCVAYLALSFRGAGANVGTFIKDDSNVDNATQQIGVQPFNVGIIMMLNSHRETQTLSGGSTVNSIGCSVTGGLEGGTFVTDNSSGNADQATHTTAVARGGTVNAVSEAVGIISSFTDNPTVQWTTNDSTAAIIGYLCIGTASFPIDLEQEALPFVGTVPEPNIASVLGQDAFPFVGIVEDHAVVPGTATVAQSPLPFVGIVPFPNLVYDLGQDVFPFIGIVPDPLLIAQPPPVIINEDPFPFVGIVPEVAVTFDLLTNYDTIGPLGIVPVHRIIVADTVIVEDVFPFVGIVPEPVVPVPGVATIIQDVFPFIGIVPEPDILPGPPPSPIIEDPVEFVGIVPEPALSFGMLEDPFPFVGIVPDPTLVAGTLSIIQPPFPFVGIVPEPDILAGEAPIIVQDPQLTVDVVPSPNIASVLNAYDDIENGIVPPPTVVAELAPAIEQDPLPFVGIVPGNASIAQVAVEEQFPFVGIVPEPRGVILRDAPGRRIRAVESL